MERKKIPHRATEKPHGGDCVSVCLKIIGENGIFGSFLGLNQNIYRDTDVLLFQCLACLLRGSEEVEIEFTISCHEHTFLNIPNWDIFNIPIRHNDVKVMLLRLKELRLARKMTQQRLAMELSMSQNTVSRYENGEREPGLAELIRIADYFDVSVDYLLERTDRPR